MTSRQWVDEGVVWVERLPLCERDVRRERMREKRVLTRQVVAFVQNDGDARRSVVSRGARRLFEFAREVNLGSADHILIERPVVALL